MLATNLTDFLILLIAINMIVIFYHSHICTDLVTGQSLNLPFVFFSFLSSSSQAEPNKQDENNEKHTTGYSNNDPYLR